MLDDVMSDNEPVITGRKNKNRSVVAGMLNVVLDGYDECSGRMLLL